MKALNLGFIFLLAAGPAIAADADTSHDMHGSMQGMHCMDGMMGMHEMALTVSSVDSATGIVNGDSGGMKLTLHFPPASLANVKAGDTIKVHLAFMK